MIYSELLWAFLKIGMFSFGGAYGSIPLMREVVLSYHWISDEMFTYFVAVSESTPGPIMINLSTYIGSSAAGFWGSVLATTAVVLPSYFTILLLTLFIKNFIHNKHAQAILSGIKPCFIGIVSATGFYIMISNLFTEEARGAVEWQTPLITGILLSLSFGSQRLRKKDFPPILLILLSAGMGALLFSFS